MEQVGRPEVPVSGNGTYQGPTASVSVKGWYTWMAEFTSADGDNLGAVHACGLPSETVKVTEASPTLERSPTRRAAASSSRAIRSPIR